MSRFDVEKFESPPDPDLICCICQCVLEGPVESPCRHVFCKVCIETWLHRNRNCPTCRHRLKKRHLKPILPIVQNMLNRLLMYCDFRINGCDERLPLEVYDKHIKECDFKMVGCRYEKCFVSVLQKFLKKHEEEECEHREKLCSKVCGLMIPVRIYDGHDCVEELRKYSQEQYALVDTFKKKVTELNTLTEKLNQQIETLRQEIYSNRERSLSFDLLISSDSDLSINSLDDYSDYRSSDQDDQRHGMTFEEFDRQDRNFWRSLRDSRDRRRRRTRYQRDFSSHREGRDEHSGEIDVVNTPPRSPSSFHDRDETDVEVDVVNESDVDRNDLEHRSLFRSPRRSRYDRQWDDSSSNRSYIFGSSRARHTASYRMSPRSSPDRSMSPRSSPDRRRHSSGGYSSDRTLRRHSWSPTNSDRSQNRSSSSRSFRSSRSHSYSTVGSRTPHRRRRFLSSSRSRSRSSHSRSLSSRYFHSRSRSHSVDSNRSDFLSYHSSARSRTDTDSDADSHVSVTSSRYSHNQNYRNDDERRDNNQRRREAHDLSDRSEERYSSDDARHNTREWLPGRRNARRREDHGTTSSPRRPTREQKDNGPSQSPRRTTREHADNGTSQSPRRTRSRSTPDNRETDYSDIRHTVSNSGESIRENRQGEGSSNNTEVETKSPNKRKRKDSEGETCETKDSKRIKRDSTKSHSSACSSTASSTHQNKGGVNTLEQRPKSQRLRRSTVTSQRDCPLQDNRIENSALDTEDYNSDSDNTWEPGTSPEDSDVTSLSVYDSVSDMTSPSVYDSGSDYEVLIPKSAGQLLTEYASDDSDDSWHPEPS
uniref:E3 ubiquitin-protein ligase NRDP1 n=2 Tax=Magallana gigas TaxID=29159 RepID=A0A8W8MI62_MAGGI|nr:serine/arginine repetitive matrix protein 2-like isoform X1 [Crassostrea gigas]